MEDTTGVERGAYVPAEFDAGMVKPPSQSWQGWRCYNHSRGVWVTSPVQDWGGME